MGERGTMAIRAAAALLVAALATSARASESVTVSAFAGFSDLRLTTRPLAARGGIGEASVGGSVLAKLDLLGVGLSLEHRGGTTQPWASSVLLGALLDVGPRLRLEALAEAGRWGDDVGALFGPRGNWLLGLRPGLSVPLPLDGPTIRIGVSAIVRWNAVGGGFGPPEVGSVGWLGLEL